MSTGFLVGGVCYETASVANDAYFSSQPVLSRFDAALNYYISTEYKFVSGVWNRVSTAYGTGWSIPYGALVAVPPVFPPCYAPSESFADGVNIGWAVAGVLILVVFVYMTRSAMVSRG